MTASLRPENKWLIKLTVSRSRIRRVLQTGSKSFWISGTGQPVFVQLQMVPAWIFPQLAAKK